METTCPVLLNNQRRSSSVVFGDIFPTYSFVFISMRPSKSRSSESCPTSDFPIYPIRHHVSCFMKAALINPLPNLQSQDFSISNLLMNLKKTRSISCYLPTFFLAEISTICPTSTYSWEDVHFIICDLRNH
jgi:hypothetical protein